MIKKVIFILLEGIISLSILASCKNDYANKMFEIYLNEPDKMISPNANIIPLGQYGTSYVACFHENMEEMDISLLYTAIPLESIGLESLVL